MFDVNQFYPTPENIAIKMCDKIDWSRVRSVLEPSAGEGNLCDVIRNKSVGHRGVRYGICCTIDCIEIDDKRKSILKSKDYCVVADDFMKFNSYSSYDLIIANPPFNKGSEHLVKAIEMMKNVGGQICFIINANTIKNAYSNSRNILNDYLETYNAEIEFIENAFSDAERKTNVEIALVYINIPLKQYSFDIFKNLISENDYDDVTESIRNTELMTGSVIDNILNQYNNECQLGLELINTFNKLQSIIPTADSSDKKLLEINVDTSEDKHLYNVKNQYIRQLRYKYWSLLFQQKEMSNLFTEEVREDFHKRINEFRNYDFTLSNIKSIQIDLSNHLNINIEKAILKCFDMFTYQYSTDCSKNIHYFNGWKTNQAFKINNKVIIWGSHDLWDKYFKRFDIRYDLKQKLFEIEKVFNYLDGGKTEHSIPDMWEICNQFNNGDIIKTRYFDFQCKKKGTIHIWFTRPDLIKKLNLFGANKKGWLPNSYGSKKYDDMNSEEKSVVDSFEGKNDYEDTFNNYKSYTEIGVGNMLMICSNESE